MSWAWKDCSCLCFTASNAKISESGPGAISSIPELQVLYLQMSKQQLGKTNCKFAWAPDVDGMRYVGPGEPNNCITATAYFHVKFPGKPLGRVAVEVVQVLKYPRLESMSS